MATVPKVHGLRPVGGHSSGDALVCFDKAAFCSYDLKQGENAPVSEEAFSAANQALEYLLKDAPILSGMKFVHWFSEEIPPEADPILQSVDFGWDEDDAEERESVPADAEENSPSDAGERNMRKQADGVPKSVWSGESFSLDKKVYHIGYKYFGPSNGFAYSRRFFSDYYNLSIDLQQYVIETNESDKKECGATLIDLIGALQNEDGRIPVFSDEKKMISHDCYHLTQGGARYIAKRMQKRIEEMIPAKNGGGK